MEDREQAQKIYGLKNAVVRRNGKKFYGGLPFVLKYIREIFIKRKSKDNDIKFDLADIMQKLLNCKNNNIDDDFINDIIDCIKTAHCGEFILEKRIKDFKADEKTVYIATVCNHYKDAARRIKSKTAYK